MRQRSFFLRLLLGNLLLVGVIAALGGSLAYAMLKSHYRQAGRDDQLALLGVAQSHYQKLWPTLKADGDLDADVKMLLPQGPGRLTVIAADGQVLGDSNPKADPQAMQNHLARPEVMQAADGRIGINERLSDTLGIRFRYMAAPVRVDGQIVGIVRLAVPVKEIAADAAFVRRALLGALAAAVAVALSLGLLVSWTWYAPLRRISRAARQIAQGDLDARAESAGPGELAELGQALNQMRHNLRQQMDSLAAARTDLQTVLLNLREGVLAVDADGQVLLANKSASRLMLREGSHPEGQNIQSIVRLAEVLGAWQDACDTGKPLNRQVEISREGRRLHLDVHARPISPQLGGRIASLLVVRDVTELARTAAMKAEFVANASHELRTPIATIRAAVDSIDAAGGEPDALPKFLDILNRHVVRLEDIARDLLDLHTIESGRKSLHLEDVDLTDLGQWSRAQFDRRAADKGVGLEIEAGAMTFRSDRKLLEMIVGNLLDNAIKFTSAGQSVHCLLTRRDDSAVIEVVDTGVGIAPADQTKVFERFYQADSSRTGDARIRGTGLGLAIVKHAAERLGASVTLQSELRRGTKVTVTLPPPAGI